MSLPVASDAAQQRLEFQLPTAPASKLTLQVPGNVEIQSGASVLARQVASDNEQTQFELLLLPQPMSLLLSLNNRKQRAQSIVMARAVMFAEITAAYERLHATLALEVANASLDEFRLRIDDALEVYSVEGPELNRWSVEKLSLGQELVIKLQKPTTGRVLLNLRLDRKSTSLGNWTLPQIQPLNVASSTSVIGLVVDDRLRVADIVSEALIPIDTQVLTAALPASLFEQEPGRPKLKAVAAFYATDLEHQLHAQLSLPANRLTVAGDTQVVISDRGLSAQVGFSLSTLNENLFSCDVRMPLGWNVESVKSADGAVLNFEKTQDAEAAQGQRIRVHIPGGLRPEAAQSLWLQADYTPPDWLAAWDTLAVVVPGFSVVNADQQTGRISLAMADDLAVSPEITQGLEVLEGSQSPQRSTSIQPLSLAYSYDSLDWRLSVTVTRKTPRLTALTHSFLHVQTDALAAHYEVTYLVQAARTKQLQFSLPESTPAEVTIRGMDQAIVKETSSLVVDGADCGASSWQSSTWELSVWQSISRRAWPAKSRDWNCPYSAPVAWNIKRASLPWKGIPSWILWLASIRERLTLGNWPMPSIQLAKTCWEFSAM